MVTVGALSIERCSEEAADANNTGLVTTSEANVTSQNYTTFDNMSAGDSFFYSFNGLVWKK